MPQAKVDTSGFEMKNLKKAAAKAFDLATRKEYYRVFYSIFTHEVHVVGRTEEPDPDWILCEDLTPFAMGQQALADVIADKLHKLQERARYEDAIRKLLD